MSTSLRRPRESWETGRNSVTRKLKSWYIYYEIYVKEIKSLNCYCTFSLRWLKTKEHYWCARYCLFSNYVASHRINYNIRLLYLSLGYLISWSRRTFKKLYETWKSNWKRLVPKVCDTFARKCKNNNEILYSFRFDEFDFWDVFTRRRSRLLKRYSIF